MEDKILYKSDSLDNVAEEVQDLKDQGVKQGQRIDANPEDVEQGLAKLVLTLVKLIKCLLEKQGVRRMESGNLEEEEIERMGETFVKLDQKLQELKGEFLSFW
ncbi:MAG: gas vesicle protein K [Clostridiales bacterium]|nr:gas vesicle protein K [Clostridiales bacterium]